MIFTNPSLPTTGQGKRKMSHILKRTSTHENRKMGKSKPCVEFRVTGIRWCCVERVEQAKE